MENNAKNAIENYQCSGCVYGSDISCFTSNENGGVGCGKHHAGTMVIGIGQIFLGMPKGFDRLGFDNAMKPNIYKSFEECEWKFNKFNIPVWKYLNEEGHTLVRGICPRRSYPFIHIYLENCIDKIDCLELTKEDIEGMD